MKKIIEKLIQKRNAQFRFSKDLDNRMLFSFCYETSARILRGCKVLFLGFNPKGIMLGNKVKFKNRHKIRFGSLVKLGNQVQLNALGTKGISIGNNASIGDFSKLVVSSSLNNIGSHITIGNNVGIGEFAYLGGAGGLEIDDSCIVGQYFSCHPENHNFEKTDIEIRHQGVTRSGIHIGRDCWIGSKVTILDNVKIGEHCVIAAGAVVNKSFPPYSVIGGVPAKLLKTRKSTSTSITTKLRLI